MPKDGQKYELVDGQIRVSPAGDRDSVVALELGSRLLAFAEQRRLGRVCGADAGFRLPGGNVRCASCGSSTRRGPGRSSTARSAT